MIRYINYILITSTLLNNITTVSNCIIYTGDTIISINRFYNKVYNLFY